MSTDPTALRLALLARGYEPLPADGKAVYLRGWAAMTVTPAAVATWAKERARWTNTGLRGGLLRMIDIDVLDESVVDAVIGAAGMTFGQTPLRRIGRAPKIALLYRCADPTAGSTRTPAFDLHGAKAQVEILGRGAQTICFGIHPDTQQPYRWLGATPEDVALADLPVVTVAELAAFRTEAAAIIAAAGGITRSRDTGDGTGGQKSAQGLEASNPQRVADALAIIQNVGPTDWSAWKRIAMAVWSATGGSADGEAAFAAWSALHPESNPDLTSKCWNEVCKSPPDRIGAGTLFWMAHKIDPSFQATPGTGGTEFDGILAEPAVPVDQNGWKSMLIVSKTGVPQANHYNAMLAISRAPELAGLLAYDTFVEQPVLVRDPPWKRDHANMTLSDADLTALACCLQSLSINVSHDVTRKAAFAVAEQNSFSSARRYMDALPLWDGKPRLDSLLIDHLGAEDTAQNRRFTGKTFIAIVARVYQPGCLVKTMLVLEGSQDLGKSKFCSAVSPTPSWVADTPLDIGSKDALIALRGKLITEWAELATLSRADANRAKAFLSAQKDTYRPPHGTLARDHLRQGVFVGTVNPGADGYLKDETGAVRFWPVVCGVGWDSSQALDETAVARDRKQLWAEAMYRYRAGEKWWLTTAAERQDQAETAAERYEGDVWDERIAEFVASREEVTIAEILSQALGRSVGDHSQRDKLRVGKSLASMGWTRGRQRIGDRKDNKVMRLYVRPADQPITVPDDIQTAIRNLG